MKTVYQVQARSNKPWCNDWFAMHVGNVYDVVETMEEAEKELAHAKEFHKRLNPGDWVYEYRIAKICYQVEYIEC